MFPKDPIKSFLFVVCLLYDWNLDDNEQDFEDMINIVMKEDNFKNGVYRNSTLLNQNSQYLGNKRDRMDEELDDSTAKKNKKVSEEPINHGQ